MKWVDYKQVYTRCTGRLQTIHILYTGIHRHMLYIGYTLYKHMHKDYISFTEYQAHSLDYRHRLVICTGVLYTGLYGIRVYYMHRHMVTILYTQQCIQSPPTDVQHTRYILYTGLNRVYRDLYTVYTGTSTLLYTDLYTGPYYTVGHYEQAYTQATNE